MSPAGCSLPRSPCFGSSRRGYYMAPAYPMLLAAGAVVWERRMAAASPGSVRFRRILQSSALAAGAALAIAVVVPIPSVGSGWWNLVNKVQDDWREEIGWPELVAEVARVRDSLPAEERSQVAIMAGNYGEAGAIDLYGGPYSLPQAICGTNSFWLRGYGKTDPRTLIVTGLSRTYLEKHFESVELAGQVTNRYGVANEETTYSSGHFRVPPAAKSLAGFLEGVQAFRLDLASGYDSA